MESAVVHADGRYVGNRGPTTHHVSATERNTCPIWRPDRVNELEIRLTLFSLFPLALGWAIRRFDPSAADPVRRIEALVVPLFIVGVGGGGMTLFIQNAFIAGRPVAGYAALVVAVLGSIAAERRDGFRYLAIIAAMVLAVSLYAGVNLLPPIALLALLKRLKRVETEPPTIVLRGWMIPVRRASVGSLAVVAVAFPIGNATGQVVAATVGAIVVGAGVFWWIVRRSASHRVVAA